MTALELISRYILEEFKGKRSLFVALQGPQGSGKSTLSARLQSDLQAPPHSLRVAVLSIDDLYLPHEGLVSLATSNSENILWKGRGQPGTHDVDLGVQILSALKHGASEVELPRFDKSLFGGEGDRLPMDTSGPVIKQPPPVDIVIFEGWCVGFNPISDEELLSRWNGIWTEERHKLRLEEDQMGRLVDIRAINEKLKDYARLWSYFDVFVQLRPLPPSSSDLSQHAIIYKWRLEQEHNMKALNGGRGMSDAVVKSFVDRYIPGYVFFGNIGRDRDLPLSSSGRPRRGMTLTLDEERRVISISTF
ncbi:P-loop containing nucleoside triphosphate hydrolase protein [Gymnopilus junonius]|uniref:P-loop containing nucleoside triphosphate hydrolase protein n=1 Tax=Gymnopilus junonius TaxID=109634 RepID=A0A9P5P1X4_GYMJU|nr:P-loop containing nucleoside triphosphate hydrolase protein [Gymnopilus junonius]